MSQIFIQIPELYKKELPVTLRFTDSNGRILATFTNVGAPAKNEVNLDFNSTINTDTVVRVFNINQGKFTDEQFFNSGTTTLVIYPNDFP